MPWYLFKMRNLQKALDDKVLQITVNGFEPQYSPDITHQGRGMGVRIPFPAGTNKGRIPCVLSLIVLSAEMGFDGEKMALLWVSILTGRWYFQKYRHIGKSTTSRGRLLNYQGNHGAD
jgi:hypothetical protein